MKFVLLLARGLAGMAGAHEVQLTHLRGAISHLELLQSDLAVRLCEYLGVPTATNPASSDVVSALAHTGIEHLDLHLSDELAFEILGYDYVFYRVPADLYTDARLSDHLPPLMPGAAGGTSPAYSMIPESGSLSALEQEKYEKWQRSRKTETRTPKPFASAPSIDADGADTSADMPNPTQNTSASLQSVEGMLGIEQAIREALTLQLHGQSEAIDALCDAIFRQAMLSRRNGPLVTLFMVGPPGTGKTFACSIVGRALGADWPLKSIDMSSMTSPNQAFALTGLSKGYGEAVPGELTDFVRVNPKCIVVLENLHRAHPNNQSVLLPMFDGGFLTDQFGFYPDRDHRKPAVASPHVDFRNVILIITTNAGTQAMQQPDFLRFLDENPEQASRAISDLLAEETSWFGREEMRAFSPELLSRLEAEKLLFFRPLGLNALVDIASDTFRTFQEQVRQSFGTALVLEPANLLLRAAVMSLGPELDARLVSGPPLTEALFGKAMRILKGMASVSRPESMKVSASRTFLDAFEDASLRLGSHEPVRELRRKQWALTFRVNPIQTGDSTHFDVSSPEWRTTRRARDFNRPGSLQVVLPDVTFSDIAGHDRVKQRLLEVVRLLKSPQKLRDWGLALPAGMLLYGPPGTGKTMLAKALAREAELPFIAATGPELLRNGFVSEVFARVRHYAPAILFLDEIDVLGVRGRSDCFSEVINQVLTELDGFAGGSGGVFVVVATNFPSNIDPALLRPGRIDLHVEVPSLDPAAREFFLVRLKKLPGGEALDVGALVRFSSGMSGAQLEMVRRELGLDIIRTGRRQITQQEAVEIINVVKYGERRGEATSQSILEHVAIHEAGHAIASCVLNPDQPIEQVSIVARAQSAGFVSFRNESAVRPRTRREVIESMAVALAGRAAQRLRFGEDGVDDGAQSDLAHATRVACLAIGSWGLDPKVGNRSIATQQGGGLPDVPIDRLDEWIQQANELAELSVKSHYELVTELARMLMKTDTISGDELMSLIGDRLPKAAVLP
jgi:cell division protease FtsH